VFRQYKIQPRIWDARTRRMEPVSLAAYDRFLAGLDAGAMKAMAGKEAPKKNEAAMKAPPLAARESKSKMSQMAHTERYNLAVGVYTGFVQAYDRVKPIPRTTAEVDFVAMARAAKVTGVEGAVDCFSRRFLSVDLHPDRRAAINTVSRTATAGAALVRDACSEYKTLVDYGSDNDLTLDLKKVAAMIAAGLPTRLYYVSQGGYDHHAAQADLHNLLLVYLSDALRGFVEDVKRIGRADDVAVMVFTEFGRRVQENASKGTDHGTATPMFVLGHPVKGGFHGKHPSLTDLDNGNLKMTTDFRSVDATVIKGWMGYGDARTLLKGDFPTLGLFA
jgi:hypothetical protein